MTVVARSKALQGVLHAADHARPVSGGGLAKLAQRRIPRTVVAVLQPAPAGVETIQQPNRFAEGTGQMRNRRIDGDDKIEVVDQCRRVGKIINFLGEIVQSYAARWTRRLGGGRTFLQ